MSEFLHAIAPLLVPADLVLFASFWLWKGRGKPLPRRLEPARRWPIIGWFLTRHGLVLGGF